MIFRSIFALSTLAVLTASNCSAAIYSLQPGEGTSSDTYVYENFANGPPMFNSGNLGVLPGFTDTLGISKTTSAPATHNTVTLLAFDLSSLVGVDPNTIVSATLKLTTAPGLSFYQAPSGASPATLEAYANASTWTEAGVTWNTKPAPTATILGSQAVTGANEALSLSSAALTALVKDWLTTPANNLGFQLVQSAEVNNGNGRVGITIYSADALTAANRPLLEITTVPEPSSLFLLGCTGIALTRLRRRR